MNNAASNDAGLRDDTVSETSPDVRVVKGNPSDEDLAALVAVVTAARNGSGSVPDSRPPELWGSPELLHRRFAPQSTYSFAASARYPQ
ncbi:MAG: acyl-CoA carboxylase epsilon subunit [Rhodococcus sp. (in: high G+C Gram-positive bacteria)]